jgi:hypothetical protein
MLIRAIKCFFYANKSSDFFIYTQKRLLSKLFSNHILKEFKAINHRNQKTKAKNENKSLNTFFMSW